MHITKNAVGNKSQKSTPNTESIPTNNSPAACKASLPRPANHAQQQVEQLLLQGLRYEDIAKQLGVGRSAICFHATNIYRDHNVKIAGN